VARQRNIVSFGAIGQMLLQNYTHPSSCLELGKAILITCMAVE